MNKSFNGKKKKWSQTMEYKIVHIKLNIKNTEWSMVRAQEGYTVSAPLVSPVVLLFNDTHIMW